MYSNNANTDIKNHRDIFDKEAFSKREAWNWLFNNAHEEKHQNSIKASLRILAQEWQWPKTKVARFLKDLIITKLIEIENHSSYSLIKLIKNNNPKIISLDLFSINQAQPLGTETGTVNDTAQAQAIQDIEENLKTASGTLNGTENQKIAFSSAKINQLGQKRDNFGTENGTAQTKAEYKLQTSLETETGTIPGQYQDSDGFSEAEKKEKKKRKEKKKQKKKRKKYQRKIFPKGNTKRKV